MAANILLVDKFDMVIVDNGKRQRPVARIAMALR